MAKAAAAVVAEVEAAKVAAAGVAVAAAAVVAETVRVGLAPTLVAQADAAAVPVRVRVRVRERRAVPLDPKAAPAVEMMAAEVSNGPADQAVEEPEADRGAGVILVVVNVARPRKRVWGETRSKDGRPFVNSCSLGIGGSMRS